MLLLVTARKAPSSVNVCSAKHLLTLLLVMIQGSSALAELSSAETRRADGIIKASPLAEALAAVAEGKEGGVELARTLLARADIDVNAGLTRPDGTKDSPLSVALKAVVLGNEGGVELARTLLSRADIDVNASATNPDGTKISPLSLALQAVKEGKEGAADLVVLLDVRGATPRSANLLERLLDLVFDEPTSERAQLKRIVEDANRRHAMKKLLKERDEL